MNLSSRRGATPESVSQTFKKLTPQKPRPSRGPFSGLRSFSSHFSSRFWSSARGGPRAELNITVQPGTVPCCAAHLSSAQVQLRFSSVQSSSVRLSAAQCSAVQCISGLAAGHLALDLCVLCRPFPGSPRSGLRCFARWIIHICCPLALECNLKTFTTATLSFPPASSPSTALSQPTPDTLFALIQHNTPCPALPWPRSGPDNTP